jgi:hypothetical protein
MLTNIQRKTYEYDLNKNRRHKIPVYLSIYFITQQTLQV